jgi:hypothetical protein
MTEAQKTLHYIAENMKMQKSISEEGYKHFQMAIKALEQEPCEDCVGRKAVKEVIMKCEKISEYSMDGYIDSTIKLEVEIDSLPSVTPTRKKGKWIYNEKESDLDYYVYNCSICRRQINFLYDSRQIKNYPYCHCGAEMESEE